MHTNYGMSLVFQFQYKPVLPQISTFYCEAFNQILIESPFLFLENLRGELAAALPAPRPRVLSLYYTEAESTERYSQFPLIIEKFAFVRKYMKENYGIDLEAIAKGPNDWDIQPHPEIPGNNDEDGGDDDDPWAGFDW